MVLETGKLSTRSASKKSLFVEALNVPHVAQGNGLYKVDSISIGPPSSIILMGVSVLLSSSVICDAIVDGELYPIDVDNGTSCLIRTKSLRAGSGGLTSNSICK